MFDFLDKIARHFRNSSWRESVAGRNELIRSLALHMGDNGIADVERVKKMLRHSVGYYEMEESDQVLFRQHTSWLKTIVTGWSLATAADQAAFRAGAIPPSTLASNIKAAGKAALA